MSSVIDKTVDVDGYDSSLTELAIPEKVTHDGSEYSVTGIGSYTFSECTWLLSVTIPTA